MPLIRIEKTLSLQGTVTPPSSKSQSIRGLVFALLANGESQLFNCLTSEDLSDALRVCRALGATVHVTGNQLTLHSTGLPLTNTTNELYSGNSGITTCFLLPLLGLRQNHATPINVDCGNQMRDRLIDPLLIALRTLGLNIHSKENNHAFPLMISGSLQGGIATIDGLNSQYISALLIALPCADKDSVITVHHLHERPYVEMTLAWLNLQKIRYQHQRYCQYDVFHIPGRQTYPTFTINIGGDFSSASYFIAAAALCRGTVTVLGLDFNDAQGDKRLIPLLQTMGADITVEATRLIIRGGKILTGIVIDANDIPDLVPTLAVVGCYATGKTIITHAPQARFKETDRIHSMCEGLSRLGAKIDEQPDGMIICQSTLQGTRVKGYNDHRTVMALSVAGLLATGVTLIEDAQAIMKTFPDFVTLMQSLSAKMAIIDD